MPNLGLPKNALQFDENVVPFAINQEAAFNSDMDQPVTFRKCVRIPVQREHLFRFIVNTDSG